jgi:hypothetical protein
MRMKMRTRTNSRKDTKATKFVKEQNKINSGFIYISYGYVICSTGTFDVSSGDSICLLLGGSDGGLMAAMIIGRGHGGKHGGCAAVFNYSLLVQNRVLRRKISPLEMYMIASG